MSAVNRRREWFERERPRDVRNVLYAPDAVIEANVCRVDSCLG